MLWACQKLTDIHVHRGFFRHCHLNVEHLSSDFHDASLCQCISCSSVCDLQISWSLQTLLEVSRPSLHADLLGNSRQLQTSALQSTVLNWFRVKAIHPLLYQMGTMIISQAKLPTCENTDHFFQAFDIHFSYTAWGKSRFTVVSMQNRVYSCIINYCIIFHTNNCKPTSHCV